MSPFFRMEVISADDRLMHEHLSGAVLGAFYSVHAELGHGFLESVYANAMAVILRNAGVRVQREIPYNILFKGVVVGQFRADLVINSRMLVEVKAAPRFPEPADSLLITCLRATGIQVGLLLNFGEKPKFRRVTWSEDYRRPDAPPPDHNPNTRTSNIRGR